MGTRQTPTVIFLDVDGVLSIEDPARIEQHREQWPGCGPAWPIPWVDALLRTLDRDTRVRPVWMTYWERRAWRWNDRAGTRRWPVAFPLSSARLQVARQLLRPSETPEDPVLVDGKLLAACYYLRRRPRQRAVWIEDGFMPETVAWAAATGGRVRLVDASAAAIAALLVADPADAEATARAFLDACLGAGTTW
jgi:hypothetical protein